MKEFSFHYLTALLAVGGCLAGCGSPPNGHIVIAIDLSDAEPKRLLAYADLAYKCQRKFATFTCIVYGAEADVVYEGPAITDRSRFNEKLGKGLSAPRTGLRGKFTSHAAGLHLAAKQLTGSDSTLLVLTDGGEEDVRDGIKKGVEQLPSGIAIYVFGVLPEHRAKVTESFSGRPVLVRSLTDAEPKTMVKKQ